MQSQCSLDASFSGPLSLSLSKFSYATVPEDSNAPIPWIHLSGKGSLFAVFEKCCSWDHQGQPHDHSRFRVSNGAEVLEDLNLIALAAEARKAIGQNQVSNILNRPSAVTIIVKKPCVAVRYPSGQGQIRRFQVRFLHDTDYYAAMGRFSEANAPVTEAGTFPAPQQKGRPFSSPSSVLYPSDSASCLNSQPPSISLVLPLEKYSITSSSSIPNGGERFLGPATSASPAIQDSTPIHPTPQTISSSVCDQKSRRDVYALPNGPSEPAPVRPQHGSATSPYWNDGRGPYSSTALSAPVTSFSYPPINLYEPRPSTAPAIQSQRLSEMLPPKRDLPFSKILSRSGPKASKNTNCMPEIASPVSAPREKGNISESSFCPSSSQELQTRPALQKSRTKRTPAKKAPARVTKKPAAPRSRKKAASVREITPIPSVEELLKCSQETAKGVTRMSKTIDTQVLLARVEERRAVATCRNPVSEHHLDPCLSQGTTAVMQQDQNETFRTPSCPTGSNQAREAPQFEETKICTSVNQVHGSQEGHNNDSQALPISHLSIPPDVPATTPNPPHLRQALSEIPQNNTPIPSEPAVPSLANLLTEPLASLWRDPHFAGSPSLAEWAKHPEEERRASLETFVCRNIQDEDFYKLCQDLDGTWQRAFLGKMLQTDLATD